MTLVFVYGTLLRGQHNHRLLAGARFVASASTEPVFSMHHLGGFPGLVSGGVTSVFGEIYEVDEPTLALLDRLEGHPKFYRRTEIALKQGIVAETYLLTSDQVSGLPLIESGCWKGGLTR